jgi:hypothetical protein
VSHQRIYQIVNQLHRRIETARPAGVPGFPRSLRPTRRTGLTDTHSEVSRRLGVRSRASKP